MSKIIILTVLFLLQFVSLGWIIATVRRARYRAKHGAFPWYAYITQDDVLLIVILCASEILFAPAMVRILIQ